jgi:DNA-binding CsgD family transcriptional regulator
LNDQLHNLLANLTPKEAEILGSFAGNNGIEQVAAKLNMNEETVRRHLRSILNKLVSNDQARAFIEAAQSSLIIRGVVKKGGPSAEYVTKAEFNEFKESLMERFKSFIGKMS